MKKILPFALCLAAVYLAGAEWDFGRKDVLKGSFPLTLRGKSALNEAGLFIPAGKASDRAGAATVKIHPELTPQGSFSCAVEFTLDGAANRTQSYLVLLDNKYVPMGKNPAQNSGFMLYLRKNSNGTFVPQAAFGYGDKSVNIQGKALKIAPDKKHLLEMKYSVSGKVDFIFDGKNAGSASVPAQSIAPAKLPLHIGDRAGASYWPLGGTVSKVKIETPAPAKKAVAETALGEVKWDFTKAAVLKGKYAPKLRKNAKLADGLAVTGADVKVPGGALLSGRFPALTPANAFEITAEIVLDGKFKRTGNWAVIYDSKYVAMPRSEAQKRYHKGFMFFLMPRGKDIYRIGGAFGFGETSAQAVSKDVEIKSDVPCRVSMLFSATGKVTFSLNGKAVSTVNVPAGNIAVPDGNTAFGDRVGANYYPLGGVLKTLEIKAAKYTPVAFSAVPEARRVFERGEKKSQIKVKLQNFTDAVYKNIRVEGSSETTRFAMDNAELKGKSDILLTLDIDSNLLCGTYNFELTAFDAAKKKIASDHIEYTVVPAYGDFMPVILWDNYDDFKLIRESGFTHQMVHLFPRMGNFDPKTLAKWIEHLDGNLKVNLYTFGNLHTHFRFLNANRFLRTDRNGNVYPRKNLEASNPEAQKEFSEAARTTVEAVGGHPAFDGVLINSEVRDSSLPSFKSGVEPAAFKKFAGYDIPVTVNGKTPRAYAGDSTFPWDRVISETRPDLHFLRWFWLEGDGWNPLQTLLADTMRQAMKDRAHADRFFTFYDPATRVPPMWGSGGDVDMISQWTYTYPDPIKIGQATDEVIAMADGNPKQKIASMTQAIWYRSQTAPIDKTVANAPAWLEWEPEAQFISVAPDSLREALWSKISRRLDAIMYHGVGSILARTDHKLYRLTNLKSLKVLKSLCETVIQPLGPVLKRVPERPAEVAILESTASSFYAPKHFPMGWSKGWAADLHLALQWGHFQPAIVYDEHLLKGKNIDQLKVLFVPGLEVVTDTVLAALNKLRSRGVVIIGDEFTTPALMVDYRMKSVTRNTLDPAATKEELQKLGIELAMLLSKHKVRKVMATNQDLIVRRRGNDKADYIFVVNDKRTYGRYVGQWRLVQEKGLPNSGGIVVNHSAVCGYDLVKHREVPLVSMNNKSMFYVNIAPGDGMLVLLLDRKIDKVTLDMPGSLEKGRGFEMNITVADEKNQPIAAILPIELSLLDTNGKKLPGSGYYAAVNGSVKVKEVVPTNLKSGNITVKVRCLASGKSVSKTASVK